jgi:BirA family transcriptional regulator, biotin operon repressor / biotin---[acetyl-CoA-carboxylase] ligase
MQLDPIAIAAGVRLIALSDTTSTNEEALRNAHMRSPVWVTAVTQTRGRGRHGRNWMSPPGNLYASLGIVHPARIDRAAELAFVTALAVRDAVIAEAPTLAPQLTFKWPNDLLLEGRKCAGILIEGEVRLDPEDNKPGPLTVVIGIGVNCVSHPTYQQFIPAGLSEPRSWEDSLTYPATDLRAHGADVTAEQLFTGLSATMYQRIAQWDRGAGLSAILSDWRRHVSGIGETIGVRDQAGDREKVGRFTDLDESGRLLLDLPDGTREKIAAGDVFLFTARGGRPLRDQPG